MRLSPEPEEAVTRLRPGLPWPRLVRRRDRLRRRRRIGDRWLIRARLHRQQQVGIVRAPAIADAEIHRLRAPEQRGIGLLVAARKFADRAGIMAEREKVPSLRIVIAE